MSTLVVAAEHGIGAGQAYLWAVLGIALSVLIPVVVKAVREQVPQASRTARAGPRLSFPDFAKPYLLVALMSLLVGILVVAFVEFKDWRGAVVGGYAWDATLQKIRTGSTR